MKNGEESARIILTQSEFNEKQVWARKIHEDLWTQEDAFWMLCYTYMEDDLYQESFIYIVRF